MQWDEFLAEAEAKNRALGPSLPKKWNTLSRHERDTQKYSRPDQKRLTNFIRPRSWCASDTFNSYLDADTLSLVVRCLLKTKCVDTIKCLALADKRCAAIVSTTIEAVRVHITNAMEKTWHLEAHDPALSDPCIQWKAAMKEAGIGDFRIRQLVAKRGTIHFHNQKSILGHVSQTCELCGNCFDISKSPTTGPVTLFACTNCVSENRVQCVLGRLPRFGRTSKDDKFITVKLYTSKSVVNRNGEEKARFMLSRKTQQRRRMVSAGKSVRISRQLLAHEVEITHEMRCFLNLAQYAKFANGETAHSSFLYAEFWLNLPPEFTYNSTFASMMGITESEAMTVGANDAALKAVAKTNAIIKDRKRFKSFWNDALELRAAVQKCLTWRDKEHQIIQLCFASGSYFIRAVISKDLCVDEFSKKEILSLSDQEFKDAKNRLTMAANIIHGMKSQFPTSDFVLDRVDQRRTLLISVLSKIQYGIFYANMPLYRASRIMRGIATSKISLRMGESKNATEKGIHATFDVDIGNGKTHRIVLKWYISSWGEKAMLKDLQKTSKRTRSKLNNAMLKTLTRFANWKSPCDGTWAKKSTGTWVTPYGEAPRKISHRSHNAMLLASERSRAAIMEMAMADWRKEIIAMNNVMGPPKLTCM